MTPAKSPNRTSPGPRRPAVIVHDLDQARRALDASARADVPIHLHSAPGAGGYLGPSVFKEIVDQARAAVPKAEAVACLDCADEPATALAALRLGLGQVSLDAPDAVMDKVRDAAAQSGAELVAPPAEALDLGEPDSDSRLDAWLGQGTGT